MSSLASRVFAQSQHAQFLAAAAAKDQIPNLHNLPEVIVTGRANVGKSSLLNAVLGRTNLLHTSKKPGRTKTLNFYRVGEEPGRLALVDAPGYGARGRPEWGDLFDYYVENRTELKRVYILFNAKHGLNESDRLMLSSLSKAAQTSSTSTSRPPFTLQAILTKADLLLPGGSGGGATTNLIRELHKEIFEIAPTCLPPILTAAGGKAKFGIEDVRKSVVEACGIGRVESKVVHS